MRIAFWGLALSLLAVVVSGMPLKASADTITSQTQQILPPGGASCAPVVASGFIPYIYNGSLDSFDFTVPDPSYVAVGGVVGSTPMPLQFMTRRLYPNGTLRVHVDIPSTRIGTGLPIQITLLSAKTSPAVTCLSLVMMVTGESAGIPSVPPPPVTHPTVPPPVQPSKPSTGGSSAHGTSPNPATTTAPSSTTTPAASGFCTSKEGTWRLWLMLLGLYGLLTIALVWQRWPESWAWTQIPEWRVTGILVPLILLLGFWYFFAACRSVWWIPLAIVGIAALGSFLSFRNDPRVNQLLLLDTNEPKK